MQLEATRQRPRDGASASSRGAPDKGMRVLLVSNLFAPDELAGAALYTDLVRYLSERNHEVRVLCAFSYYPAWRLRTEDAGVSFRDEMWEGIRLRRIAMYVPARPSGITRVLSDISFFYSILRRNFRDCWLPDVVITASPMLSQCVVQRFLYPGRAIPRMIVVQDFVVDAALELGLLRCPVLPGLLRDLERWSFRCASTLSTISEPMLTKLRTIVRDDRRTLLIPNWIHQSLQGEIDHLRAEGYRRRDRVLFYGGNFGVKQGLPRFAEIFSECRGCWTLEIHGGGSDCSRLKATAHFVAGIVVGEVLDQAEYVKKLLTCSACLITQMCDVGANFLPSKLLPALATGTPVLAVCDLASPLGREVQRGRFGEVVAPGDRSALTEVLEKWRSEPELMDRLGRNALQWAKRFERAKILRQYEAELKRLAGVGRRADSNRSQVPHMRASKPL
jgi:colanic acid biosynthesis glycosyl transferase WcaI